MCWMPNDEVFRNIIVGTLRFSAINLYTSFCIFLLITNILRLKEL